MKAFALLYLLLSIPLFSNASECKDQTFSVMDFNKDGEYIETQVNLTKLECDKKAFIGEHFQIVNSISEEPISFDSDEKTLLRAATVYYHLNLARVFWINQIGSEFIKSLPRLTIRIEMARKISRTRHFGGEDIESNNAWTIVPGEMPPKRGNKKWGYEIWFAPIEFVDVTEELEFLGTNPVTQGLNYVEAPMTQMAQNNMLYESLDKLIQPDYNTHQTFEQILVLNIGTIATIKGITWASQYLDYVLVEDEFYMDTALTADVIYHEFAHIALSQYLEPKHSRPVIEGMADYFVAAQTGRETLYQQQEGIIKIRPKYAVNDDVYTPEKELQRYATRDFVLSLLWKMRTNLEDANKYRVKRGRKPVVNIDQLIFNARKFLDESSQISPDLSRALTDSLTQLCNKNDKDYNPKFCGNKRMGFNAINKAFFTKGLETRN